MGDASESSRDDGIAVIGMAGRFPGAADIDAFWQNLIDGIDGLSTFTEPELRDFGLPENVTARENFVARGSVLADFDSFDAERFGFSPREAATTDPQARVFLETVHDAFEHAGYDPFGVPGEVGVFAGCNPIDYALLLGRPDPTDSLSAFDQMIGNDRDFLATRVSHRLGLRGPAMNVQTACSTSLVAVHMAAQNLLDYQCSMAVAGGVSINLRQGVGYFYQQGMILSPDGHCRAFDADANGTTLGQAVGAVILKRLDEALEDGDTIHAVIRGSALNNDGDQKISYTAPSADGQAAVIVAAQTEAGLDAEDITYIETHGTGTKLGDPVEIEGLTRAFRLTTDATQFCAVGSVKASVGHTDAAAGVTGFIKAVLAVREGMIPVSRNFSSPNPAIDFTSSPFYVASETVAWEPTTTDRRRAGISSFGIGGTNAHVIVEQPPTPDGASPAITTPHLLVSSAPSPEAATTTATAIGEWAAAGATVTADHLATLVHGRRTYPSRAALVFDPRRGEAGAVRSGTAPENGPVDTTWMFSGQGAQFAGMARGAHGTLAAFTETLDEVVRGVNAVAGIDLRDLLLAEPGDETATERLRQTEITQPALFAVQMAMARQLQAWGVEPAVLLGHSIGEFAAATVAGVFTLDDAIMAVVTRGRLMQAMEPGVMVATRLTPDELQPHLPDGVEIATINSSAATVVGGPEEAIAAFEATMAAENLATQRLATSHAFHSRSMEPAAEKFASVLDGMRLSAPDRPMLSNVTGTWLTPDEAVDPGFWAGQIRQPVRFAECIDALAADRPDDVLVEIGPGRALSGFARSHDALDERTTAVQCLGHPRETRSGDIVALDAVGTLWTAGVDLDWEALSAPTAHRRLPAPLSRMSRARHWLPSETYVPALGAEQREAGGAVKTPTGRLAVEEWSYGRTWTRSRALPRAGGAERILVVSTGSATSDAIVEHLKATAADIVDVRLGTETKLEGDQWEVSPADDSGVFAVLGRLVGTSRQPHRVVHLGLLDDAAPSEPSLDGLRRDLDVGVNTLLSLARGLASLTQNRTIHLDVVTQGGHDVLGGERVRPSAAAVAGPVKVIPLEYSGLTARQIDLPTTPSSTEITRLADELRAASASPAPIAAIRGRFRWVHDVERLDAPVDAGSPVRHGGVYLIFGGLGGVGLSLGEYLANTYGAKLALTSRSGVPAADPGDPETTRRLERLAAVSAATSVVTEAADVTDAEQVRAVIERAERELGPINGVIMTAAVADNAGAIHRRTPEAAEAAISAKVHGSVAVAEALAGRHLDLVLLSSSIASQLYHNRFGQVGYVTANSFAEAMAESDAFSADRVVTVAWDDWTDIGMSVRAAQDFESRYGEGITLMDELHSFSPADGVQVFEQALAGDASTIFVSTTDLGARIQLDAEVSNPFLEQALAGDEGGGEASSVLDAVREAWTALLGVADLAETDDFFDLGGDSLQVARMADRLGRQLSFDVPLDLIFDNPTLGPMIAVLEERAASAGSGPGTLEEVVGVVAPAPSQNRFLARGSVRPEYFNVSVLLETLEPVTPAVMEAALAVLVERHPALRTRFDASEDGWRQVVAPAAEWTMPFTAHRVEPGHNDAEAVEAIAGDLQQSFDLEDGPLACAAHIQLRDGSQRLFLCTHHLISDRLSLLTLIDELDLLLAGEELSAPTVPYSNWSAAVDTFARADGADELVAAWNTVVPEGEPAFPRWVDAPNLNRSATGKRLELSVDRSDALLRGGGPRSEEKILLALSDALATWTGSAEPIGIDIMGHGRRDLDGVNVARSVGFFLSYSPVWLGPVDRPLDERLTELRQRQTNAWTFDALRYARPNETAGWRPPRVLFNYVGRPIEGAESRRIRVVPEPKGTDTYPDNVRDHDLAFLVEVTNDGLVAITMVWSEDRIHRSSAENLLRTLDSALREP
ncbi:MAG: SDR family oxidoreductase [Actinomycetota bacterium]